MDINQRSVREITVILIVKIVILLSIKHFYFDAPTIPKNFDQTVAKHVAGNPPSMKETR